MITFIILTQFFACTTDRWWNHLWHYLKAIKSDDASFTLYIVFIVDLLSLIAYNCKSTSWMCSSVVLYTVKHGNTYILIPTALTTSCTNCMLNHTDADTKMTHSLVKQLKMNPSLFWQSITLVIHQIKCIQCSLVILSWMIKRASYCEYVLTCHFKKAI